MFIVEPVYAQPVGKAPYLEIARPSGDLRFNGSISLRFQSFDLVQM
jgi:hypothetical protein